MSDWFKQQQDKARDRASSGAAIGGLGDTGGLKDTGGLGGKEIESALRAAQPSWKTAAPGIFSNPPSELSLSFPRSNIEVASEMETGGNAPATEEGGASGDPHKFYVVINGVLHEGEFLLNGAPTEVEED